MWFGHVERMAEERLPIVASHGHVERKRSRGRQRKIWMDNIEDLKEKNIDLTRTGEATIKPPEVWRSLIKYKSLIVSILLFADGGAKTRRRETHCSQNNDAHNVGLSLF